MPFAHDSTSADPSVRLDRGQLTRNLATNQIRDADRCTAVELDNLIQLKSIWCLLRQFDWTATFSNDHTLEFNTNSQIGSIDENFSTKLTQWSLAVNVEQFSFTTWEFKLAAHY